MASKKKPRVKKKLATGEPKFDLYQTITNQFIAALEAGVAPWRKPWVTLVHRNIDGRRYNGINSLLTAMAAHQNGWSSTAWLTFKQITEKGGKLKGERGDEGRQSTIITYWKRLLVKDEAHPDGKVVPLLRYYRVFNLDQVDGITLDEHLPGEQLTPVEAAETVILNMPNPPIIRRTGSNAYYEPQKDRVTVPPLKMFGKAEDFYAATFHELAHSTGHASRLNRPSVAGAIRFGDEDYSREELVAELTGTFVSASCGLEPLAFDNSTAYLANWIKALTDDNRAIVVAAGLATKAADYMLGIVVESQVEVAEAA